MSRYTRIEDSTNTVSLNSEDELEIENEQASTFLEREFLTRTQSDDGAERDLGITAINPKSKCCCSASGSYMGAQFINVSILIFGICMLLYNGKDLLIDHIDRRNSDYIGLSAGGLLIILSLINIKFVAQVQKNKTLPVTREYNRRNTDMKIVESHTSTFSTRISINRRESVFSKSENEPESEMGDSSFQH
jgi:hypothetical protein